MLQPHLRRGKYAENRRYIKLPPAAIAPALIRHVDPFATMYRRGTTVFFLIVLLVLTPCFLPEKLNSNVLTKLRRIKEPPSAPLECTSLQISHILLSPTFLLHLGWIIGFSLLSLLVILVTITQFAFCLCSFIVFLATQESLPKPRLDFIKLCMFVPFWLYSLLAVCNFVVLFIITICTTLLSRKAMKDEDMWTVFVRSCHGEILTIGDITASSSILRLYSIVSAKSGIPSSKMCLMRGPRKLKFCATLGVSGLENECTIDLHVPGYGGGKGNTFTLIPFCYKNVLFSYRKW